MAVIEVDINKLNDAKYNPRITLEPGMTEYEKLKKSIDSFGLTEPIIWNKRTGNVVGGHQRLRILRDEGYKTVPCSVVDLSEKDEKTLNLALNKIRGEWDYDKLRDVLSCVDLDVADLSGFWDDEIAVICAQNEDGIEEGERYDDYYYEEEDGEYVVTLLFKTRDDAREWLERNGFPAKMVKDSAHTTIVSMDGYTG